MDNKESDILKCTGEPATSRENGQEIRFISHPEKPAIALYEKESGMEKLYFGAFAYKLEVIAKPRTQEEKEQYFYNGVRWHDMLLTAICSKENNYYKILIEYNPAGERQGISISLVAGCASNNVQKTETAIRAFLEEVGEHTQPQNIKNNAPFILSPISSRKELGRVVSSFSVGVQTVFQQNCIEVKGRNCIGFKNGKTETTQIGYNLPVPTQTVDPSMTGLFSALDGTSYRTCIELCLKPINLTNEQIFQIKNAIEKPDLINDIYKNEKDKVNYIEYWKRILNPKNGLYSVKVSAATENPGGMSSMLNHAIGQTFFGENPGNRTVINHENGISFTQGEWESNESNLEFVNTIENTVNSFRLPFPNTVKTPGIKTLPSSFFTVPDNLPEKGVLLGEKKQMSKERKIYISQEDLYKHFCILGKSGSGKTTLLRSMMMDMAIKGSGFGFIDIHGDTSDWLRENLPESRKKDLIYFNPADVTNNKIRLNILQFDQNFPEQKTFIIQNLIAILSQLYDWKTCAGPQWERYNDTFCRLVMSTIQGSLPDVVRALEDKEFRNGLIQMCNDKKITDRIDNMMECSGDYSYSNFQGYLSSKYLRFTESDFLGPIISTRQSNIDFRDIIDNRQILIIKLPKGRLGDDVARFIGMILINRILLAAYSREDIPYEKRVAWTLYLDEVQNFYSEDIVSCFAEARKYFISLVVATQSLTSLRSDIANALLANVGSICTCRVGMSDATYLEPFFAPEFTAQDMINIGNYNVFARILVNSMPASPFVFQTKP